MLVSCSQMAECERRAFERGVSAADLMEEAGRGIASVVRQFFPRPGVLGLFLGKGNNAGDALVAARELARDGWEIRARLAFPVADFKPLPAGHWAALGSSVREAVEGDLAGIAGRRLVLLDGLLGIGATGPLEGKMKSLAAEMNALRRSAHATTVAMDIPSGLDGDSGQPCEEAAVADITVTIAAVKRGLVADAATDHVGRLALVPLPDLRDVEGEGGASLLRAPWLRTWLPRRSFDFHKGEAGRVGIIAGSRGFLGAAVMTATGALRGGAGLVTLLAKEDTYALLAERTPPEVMVRQVGDFREALQLGFDVMAIGPGLGMSSQTEILRLLRDARMPVVLDADALTMVAHGKLEALAGSPGPRLLTPHPGEMARLVERETAWKGLDRRGLAEAFVARFQNVTLLLKGARTVVASCGEVTALNSTGSPGMATGGVGDVLTGLCAALVGQGAPLHHAACLGAWLSGRAAEIAIGSGQSEESFAALDVPAHLGAAFSDLRLGAW